MHLKAWLAVARKDWRLSEAGEKRRRDGTGREGKKRRGRDKTSRRMNSATQKTRWMNEIESTYPRVRFSLFEDLFPSKNWNMHRAESPLVQSGPLEQQPLACLPPSLPVLPYAHRMERAHALWIVRERERKRAHRRSVRKSLIPTTKSLIIQFRSDTCANIQSMFRRRKKCAKK